MEVPFVDLRAQYQTISADVDDAMHQVVANADFVLGKSLEQFEEHFAKYCEARYAVGLDSGMSALELALRAHNIGVGDEVITVSHTFVATAFSISLTGARPICVDVEADTYNMDAAQIEAAITVSRDNIKADTVCV